MNNKNPMTEATNLTGTTGQDAFPPATNAVPQSNPFTGDLKGEFTSDFGTNTNAVSQIFKGGGFGSGDRNKYIILGVVVLALAAAAAYFMLSGEPSTSSDSAANDDQNTEDTATDGDQSQAKDKAAAGQADKTADDSKATQDDQAADEKPAPQQAAAQGAAASGQGNTGSLALVQPASGASHEYDETQGPAVFEWNGSADRIVFSRNANMNPVERSVGLKGKSSYQFDHPYPGTWYWRVENGEGASEVRSFNVNPPIKRNFPISAPTPGATISGNGGVVTWQGDTKVAWYSVQLTTPGSGWAAPQYRFGTSGTSVALQGVSAGSYDMRVGAFSEVAGRWEWQEVKGVTVQ